MGGSTGSGTGRPVGRRVFVGGAALAAAAAAAAMAGCGNDSTFEDGGLQADSPASGDAVAPSMDAESLEADGVKELNSVTYPEPVASDDYDAQGSIAEANELDPAFVEAVNAFADSLTVYGLGMDESPDVGPNQCLSPASLYLALALLAQGAASTTQQELLQVLGASDLGAQGLAEQCGRLMRLSWGQTTPDDDPQPRVNQMASSVWLLDDFTVKQGFLDEAADSFYASCFGVQKADDGAARAMATWVSERSGSTLQPKVALSDGWVMSLIDTVWFKDGWLYPFNEDDTQRGPFHAPADDVDVDYMVRTLTCDVVDNDEFQVAALPLDGGGSLAFMLPMEGTDPRYAFGEPANVADLFSMDGAQEAEVTFWVPKVSFNEEVQLRDILGEMGVREVFGTSADLSGISDQHLAVDAVQQGTHFAMDEMGVEASAYTTVDIATTSLRPDDLPEVEFKLERPFAFRLTDANGVVLFVGLVENPSNQ